MVCFNREVFIFSYFRIFGAIFHVLPPNVFSFENDSIFDPHFSFRWYFQFSEHRCYQSRQASKRVPFSAPLSVKVCPIDPSWCQHLANVGCMFKLLSEFPASEIALPRALVLSEAVWQYKLRNSWQAWPDMVRSDHE